MDAIQKYKLNKPPRGVRIIKLLPSLVEDEKELISFEKEILARGGEGVILRDLNSPYKYGRSTIREGYMLKLKRFKDAEAEIEGFEELVHEDGSKGNMLGSFLVVMDDIHFKIGTGFTEDERKSFWKNREKLLGELVKFKYFDVSIKKAPRHPVFLAMRSRLDI
jgi:DNA ligase-1